MSTALAERPADTLPKEQIDLIRKTVAQGATDTELQLFLYDCARRGIHPLDKLLHFTKRGGKYTPVTSIDFMRSQAAMSGEMAGSEDPIFKMFDGKTLESATVTVYRLTQGGRFGYTATARWSEYCPDNAPMWKRMPHTMLGKCAEALALRKAFPQQLAGLYSKEEMDQADAPKGYVVEAPARDGKTSLIAGSTPSVPNGGDSGEVEPPLGRPAILGPPGVTLTSSDDGPDLHVTDDPDGLYIVRVTVSDTRNANVKKHLVVLSDGRELSTINPALGALAENFCQDHVSVIVQTKATKWGEDLMTLTRASEVIF